MFYLLYICLCLIVRWEIHFNESLCFIETSPLISSVHDLTRIHSRIILSRIISLSGDIEINPGLKSNALDLCFSICHWNLNSTSTHTFTKVSFLSASISVHKFDIICLSETYLISKIPSDDENLEIVGYNLVREDRPSNSKHGGFCVYY